MKLRAYTIGKHKLRFAALAVAEDERRLSLGSGAIVLAITSATAP